MNTYRVLYVNSSEQGSYMEVQAANELEAVWIVASYVCSESSKFVHVYEVKGENS